MKKQKHPHELPAKIVKQLAAMACKANGVFVPLGDSSDPKLVTYQLSLPDGTEGIYRIRFPKLEA